ncbi:MAG: GntR family transcriptional regulator [Telmatospirillum sp.]|nr:GntR family transcriptional regulator [Telmatospirillum sp.]
MARGGQQSLRVGRNAPNLRERATVKIRNAILRLHYKPGQKLTERMLCLETGVSRTSIREALRQLEAEGLVERGPRRGLMVAALSPSEARQIYEVRLALETASAGLFVQRASAKDVEALKLACDAIERDINRKPVTDYVQSIDRFFDILMRGADNEVARSILRNLRARINYLRALTAEASGAERESETLAIMRGVVDAAIRRDVDDIVQRCKSMVERSARYAIALLTRLEDEAAGKHENSTVRRKRVLAPSRPKRVEDDVSHGT